MTCAVIIDEHLHTVVICWHLRIGHLLAPAAASCPLSKHMHTHAHTRFDTRSRTRPPAAHTTTARLASCRLPPPQVQRTIGTSDYVRRDMALKNLIQPLAGEYGMHNNQPQRE